MIQIVVPSWTCAMGRETLSAFAAGLEAKEEAFQVVPLEKAQPGEHPVICWGVFKSRFKKQRDGYRVFQDAQKKRGPLVIVERGFIKRESYYVVGFDGLNGQASYPQDRWGKIPSGRWEQLGVDLQPWRTREDGEILIIGQVPWDTSCQHVNFQQWVEKMASRLWDVHGGNYEIVFRPHPLQPRAIKTRDLPIHSVDTIRTLEEALEAAALVVTFSSTVGVQSVVAGVPTVAKDPISMVYGLCADSTTPEEDREEWARHLAYCQWTREEMAKGLVWEHLMSSAWGWI